MPEVHFLIELPDGGTRRCYSPSTVVRDHFAPGQTLTVSDFVERSRRALAEASERVRVRYGFVCSSAASELAEIEHCCRRYEPDSCVRILSI